MPLLRPLRVLRVLAFMRILQRTAAGGLAGRATTYVLGTALISLFLGAIAVLDAEQDAPGANITTFGDALWWATTTVTTAGYGDRFPVTGEGRVLAVVLMLVGIGAVGVVTASLAAWLLSHVREEQRGERG
ncbi:MAG TPA: potassium channel family protein [Nocardioides sp.]